MNITIIKIKFTVQKEKKVTEESRMALKDRGSQLMQSHTLVSTEREGGIQLSFTAHFTSSLLIYFISRQTVLSDELINLNNL